MSATGATGVSRVGSATTPRRSRSRARDGSTRMMRRTTTRATRMMTTTRAMKTKPIGPVTTR